MSYDIGVWSSYALQDHCDQEYGSSLRAANNCATFIEEAGRRAGHTINAYVKSKRVQTPTETYNESFETFSPCEDKMKYYSGLLPWFRDYMECTSFPESDSNVLLTNQANTSGGVAYRTGKYGVVGTGQVTAESNGTYMSVANFGTPEDGIQTVLHEIGHNLSNGFSDTDGDGADDHDCGAVIGYSGDDAITAMSSSNNYQEKITEENGGNECGIDYDISNIGLKQMEWSDCFAGKMQQ